MEQVLREAMNSVKVPTSRDRVYKNECMFSFDTPESTDGLYTSLTTWQSFGADYVDLDYERHQNPLYVKQVWKRVAVDETSEDEEMTHTSIPTKMAIGVKGGFDINKKSYDQHVTNYLFVMPQRKEIMLPCDEIPTMITLAIDGVLNHQGFEQVAQLAAAWEEEDRKESRYAKDLVQLELGKKISPDPKLWKCEESGMTENLWLNLSTGYIGSARKNFDGSGGTGAALKHFEETGGKYPLVVKLGTITPSGADVYSYAPDENEMVLDPYLADHLAHWGINMMQQEKTEQTTAELELKLNATHSFSKITESGSELEPLHGPGYIGLDNLGNSCYMASVMQILFSIPEMEARFKDSALSIFKSVSGDPADDLLAMMAKLATGLLSERYSKPVPFYEKDPAGSVELRLSAKKELEGYGSIKPFMFKMLIGKGHPEFRSPRQQDAVEFFQYFLDKISRAERSGQDRLSKAIAGDSAFVPTAALFQFKVEERLEDNQSGKVRYTSRSENTLGLAIDLDAALNKAQYDDYQEQQKTTLNTDAEDKAEPEPVQLQVPLSACLRLFAEPERIDDFKSPETGTKGSANKRTRLETFPPHLAVYLKRYYIADNWVPKKLDVAVLMPEELDLSELKSTGLVDGEVLLPDVPEVESSQKSTALVPDPEIVAQIIAMGFSENGAKRAALATKNAGAEASMEWVFAHMSDSDFNEPLPAPEDTSPQAGAGQFRAEDVSNLTAMGFTDKQAQAALKATGGSLERAADWLFSHADDLDSAVAAVTNESGNSGCGSGESALSGSIIDGEPKYELLGFASHLGSNTGCGHYVAHIKKEARFVLFNDEKVAVSQNPPTDLGFLYIYRRK
ncbi:unnamed protein product [Chondrus crispus]|uniref:Ubiquitin carboxyl-terminal hydrolase n=1 Tax=Chondrus crispus TaxID=2769 RepID=R7Q5P6_CHOCR|nr:unnamed protein product [Chondrus crispus]CDF33158.1 unnamed protein product [Chondrus crispus]|eukprot:XP_005712961.1 unnamed protein product [Chondrus crispus]